MAAFITAALITGLMILFGGLHAVGGLFGAAIIFGTLLYEGSRRD